MKRALMFPGQGSHAVGMGKALAEASPAAREVFQRVDEAVKQNLSQLMWEGPEDALTLTENAQPALMAVSLAVVRSLEVDYGLQIEDDVAFLAGHSLGEYSALAAGRALTIEETARLLKLRGRAMQEAVPLGQGGMAALLGLDFDAVEKIAASAGSVGLVAAANDNGPGQVVLSGEAAAVDRAIELAKEAGAKRAIKLAVSAPFHCDLMAPAAEAMAEALSWVAIEKPVVPLIANVTAQPETDPDRIRQLLISQVTSTVRWRESVDAIRQAGVTCVAEIGSGKVLSGIAKRIDRSLQIHSVHSPADLRAFAQTFGPDTPRAVAHV